VLPRVRLAAQHGRRASAAGKRPIAAQPSRRLDADSTPVVRGFRPERELRPSQAGAVIWRQTGIGGPRTAWRRRPPDSGLDVDLALSGSKPLTPGARNPV